MKIGTKLTAAFVLLAVLPLAAASVVYLRSTAEFGNEMAEHGKNLLAERLTTELRRAVAQGAAAIDAIREEVGETAGFVGRDIAERISRENIDAAAPVSAGAAAGFVLSPQTGDAAEGDLARADVFLAADAEKDRLSGLLDRLSGFHEIARAIVARDRNLIAAVYVALENGITVTYPSGAVSAADDFRETDWYMQAIQNSGAYWHRDAPSAVAVAAPITLSDGRIAGVVRLTLNLDRFLHMAMTAAQLPVEATGYLIRVADDAPQLLPDRLAILNGSQGAWRLTVPPQPFLLAGDDDWLKVVSDIRTGVPGLESVTREDKREVWAFMPAGRFSDEAWHLAAVYPQSLIDVVRGEAADVVSSAFNIQAASAAMFAVFAAITAAVLGLFVSRIIVRPVRRLHDAARRLGDGDFSVRVEETSRDEFGDLEQGFNQLVPALAEQVRVKRDLHTAREIQQHLIPVRAPNIDGFDLAGDIVYCDETGGDYQDFLDAGASGGVVAVIGDVSGHGVGAALLMASIRSSLRAHLMQGLSGGELLNAVNRQLSNDASGGRFMTLLYLQVQPQTRRVAWISAGHEPALLYDPAIDSFTSFDGEGIPLGVDHTWDYRETEIELPEGSVLVAVTDGVREAVNDAGEHYGIERLKEAIRSASDRGAAEISAQIIDDVDGFRGDAPSRDDMSVLVVRPR